jgi:hypothetical protein
MKIEMKNLILPIVLVVILGVSLVNLLTLPVLADTSDCGSVNCTCSCSGTLCKCLASRGKCECSCQSGDEDECPAVAVQ